MADPKRLDLKSLDITKEKKQKLKQLFPEVFREENIDFDHLKRLLSEWVEPGRSALGCNGQAKPSA